MDFQDLQKKERLTTNRERISKRDIKPLEVQFRLQTFYDASDNTYKFRDNDGNSIFTIDPNTSTVTFPYPVTFAGALTFSGTVTYSQNVSFAKQVLGIFPEIRFELMEASHYTGNPSYEFGGVGADQYIRIRIDSAEWSADTFEFYYEAVMAGDTGSGLMSQLYNVTDSAAVANTEITGPTATASQRVRSTTPWTPATGVKEYAMQYKRANGTAYPSELSAAIIVRLKGL